MYLTREVQVNQKHHMYTYFTNFTSGANNMSNAVRFRQRQVLTATHKEESRWTENERSVMDEIREALPKMGSQYHMPTEKKCFLSDGFLKRLMVVTKNPDYYSKHISNQACQSIISQCVRDMRSFAASSRDYNEHPEKYTERPKLPGYKKPGGMSSVTLTNEDCSLSRDEDGMYWLKFPYTRNLLAVGRDVKGTLKAVTIVPNHGIFSVRIVMEQGQPEESPLHRRIAEVDVGVDNLAAITNNIGMPCLLFKGGVIKSANQWYNKQMAKLQSEQTKGREEKFHMTPEAHKLCLGRDNIIDDFMHKVGKAFISWCVKNDIDTVVYGHNRRWKQETNMGHKNNQEFVQIPFNRFKQILASLCGQEGISFISREESYTSKASFPDLDYIPTYGVDDEKADFSGKRRPTRYKGMYKKDGFRGLYQSSDGTIINADLNGSANIGRKEFPDMFDSGLYPEFDNVIIIRHPDLESRKALQSRQKAKNTGMSRSRQKRLRRKGKLAA